MIVHDLDPTLILIAFLRPWMQCFMMASFKQQIN